MVMLDVSFWYNFLYARYDYDNVMSETQKVAYILDWWYPSVGLLEDDKQVIEKVKQTIKLLTSVWLPGDVNQVIEQTVRLLTSLRLSGSVNQVIGKVNKQ